MLRVWIRMIVVSKKKWARSVEYSHRADLATTTLFECIDYLLLTAAVCMVSIPETKGRSLDDILGSVR